MKTYTPQEMIMTDYFVKESKPGDCVCMLKDHIWILWRGQWINKTRIVNN